MKDTYETNDTLLPISVCKECGRAVKDLEKSLVFIQGKGFVPHRDVCDGKETIMFDPVVTVTEKKLFSF